mmetsp:Transcript_24444/g.55783  ORF Transcript_24444/g.55783 Transcript_24444/m.55783 type:complete len:205 (-) Transcript_24444:674-1288(-)
MNIIPDKSQYGKLRLWGQFGFAIGSTLVGISLNRASEMAFKSAFVIHAAITFPTLLCMRSFRDDNDDGKDAPTTREGRVGADFRQGLRFLLRSPDALIFFGLVFVLGVSSGIIENFAYVRMREVGGVGKDMGISRLISSAAGVPMFWFSGEVRKEGCMLAYFQAILLPVELSFHSILGPYLHTLLSLSPQLYKIMMLTATTGWY